MEQIDLYPIDVNLLRKSTVSCELVENACIYSKKVSMENEDIISENEEIEEELNDVQTVGGSPVKSPEESSSSLSKWFCKYKYRYNSFKIKTILS